MASLEERLQEKVYGELIDGLRAKRLSARIRAKQPKEPECEGCASGACASHMKDEEGTALESLQLEEE